MAQFNKGDKVKAKCNPDEKKNFSGIYQHYKAPIHVIKDGKGIDRYCHEDTFTISKAAEKKEADGKPAAKKADE